eukprot:1577872-Prorocentrum_lima.AAC.1
MDVPLPREGGPQSSVIAAVGWSPRGQIDHVLNASPTNSDVKESRVNWIPGGEPVRFDGEFTPENIQG